MIIAHLEDWAFSEIVRLQDWCRAEFGQSEAWKKSPSQRWSILWYHDRTRTYSGFILRVNEEADFIYLLLRFKTEFDFNLSNARYNNDSETVEWRVE